MAELTTATEVPNVDDGDMLPIRMSDTPGLFKIMMSQIAMYTRSKLFGNLNGQAGRAIIVNPDESGFIYGDIGSGGGSGGGGGSAPPSYSVSAKRWRVYVLAAGSAGGASLGEVNFADSTGFVIVEDSPPTVTASSETAGHEAGKARDGFNATYWEASGAAVGSWWECEYNDFHIVKTAYIKPGDGQSTHTPAQFEIEYYVDGEWKGLGPISHTWTDDSNQIFALPETERIDLVGEAPEDGTPYARQDKGWVPAGGGAIANLTDVDLTGITDGQVLVYDDATDTFIPGDAGGGSLGALSDVDLAGLADGEILVFHAGIGMWLAQAPDVPPAPAAPTESIIVVVTDQTNVFTTGTGKLTFRMPYAFTLTGIKASVKTASSSGLITVNVKENGSSIFSTKLTINSGAKTSVGATTPAVISDSSLAADAEMTIDIDGAGTNAVGLVVTLIGHQ